MASLVESGVKNLNYGDADSVGFFQMRVGIWNQGAYKGFPEKPELQAKWFLDQAEAVKKQRIARGQSVTDPKQFGDWIADIERPAEQYRGRYRLRLGEANGLLARAGDAPPRRRRSSRPPPPPRRAAAAAATPRPPRAAAGAPARRRWPRSRRRRSTPAPPTSGAARRRRPASTAPASCSGPTRRPASRSRASPTRSSPPRNGTPVDRGDLKPGDLIFFGEPGNIYHVAISMGGDKFLHAPKTGDVVKVASLKESYFSQNYAGGRSASTTARRSAAAARPRAPAGRGRRRRRPEGGRRGAGRGRARRRRGQPPRLRPLHGGQGAGGAAPRDGAVHAGDRPQGGAGRRGAPAAAAAGRAAAAEPRRRRARAARRRAAGRRRGPGTAADAGPPIQLPDDISDDYPGNNASKDEIAKWLAKQADKHGLPPELPVMASLVESGVKNLNYGDADSVGFFQMRVGIWNQGAYKGFPEHPELQAKWFIDQALAVKKQAIARGDADFGKDPSKWGEWIADIERPAEQYRGRYQLRLKEARGLLG